MNRKTFFALAMLAVAGMMTAACNKTADDGKTEAVFEVSLAQGAQTKVDGVSEAAAVDHLDVFVYDETGQYLSTIVPTVTPIVGNTQYTVKMRLLNNVKYSFVFFAQKAGTYAFSADRKTLTVDYSAMLTNADASDAFYARINDYTVSGAFTQPVTLTRPFAQINFGSAKADYLAAEASQVQFDASLKTAISLKQVPSVLNLLTGLVSMPVDMSFLPGPYMGSASGSGTLTVSEADFPGATPVRYMGMVYVLADTGAPTPLSQVSMSVSGTQNGNAFSSTREITNVPVRGNYRTQIVGNVFTDEGVFNITLDPAYQTPDSLVNL